MSRLSIFSFRTLRIRRNQLPGLAAGLLLALALIAAAEAVGRIALAPVGRRWEYWHPDAAVKWDYFRSRTESGDTPHVVVTGDSTAHWDFDPDELQAGLGAESDVWNLAWPGNFALAFQTSTLPLLTSKESPPRAVIASFLPSGFVESGGARESEAGILSSAFCQRNKSGWLAADLLHLGRLWPSLPILRELLQGRDHSDILSRRGFFVKKGVFQGNASVDTDAPVDPRAVTIDPRRFAVLERLASSLSRRGTQFVVVIPPSMDRSKLRTTIYLNYRRLLEQASREYGFHVVDCLADNALAVGDFADKNHLNPKGARQLSRRIVAALARDVARASTADHPVQDAVRPEGEDAVASASYTAHLAFVGDRVLTAAEPQAYASRRIQAPSYPPRARDRHKP